MFNLLWDVQSPSEGRTELKYVYHLHPRLSSTCTAIKLQRPFPSLRYRLVVAIVFCHQILFNTDYQVKFYAYPTISKGGNEFF